MDPTTEPTMDPTRDPTGDPTEDPTMDPTEDPTGDPTVDPTMDWMELTMDTDNMAMNEYQLFHGVGKSETESVSWNLPLLNEMSGSMLILIGAMSAVMILMVMFYAVRQSEKEEYESLE